MSSQSYYVQKEDKWNVSSLLHDGIDYESHKERLVGKSIQNEEFIANLEYPVQGFSEELFVVPHTGNIHGIIDTETSLNSTNISSKVNGLEEPTMDEIVDYIYPKLWTWVLIFCHCVVFVVGLVGNCLVCVAVYRNHSMRTVTNYFILNLAMADFLVILFCLPPSVVWDVTSTWWFGVAMCKIVLYLQVRSEILEFGCSCC
ncbi:hypothetical protein JTB14_030700 [Gonioctena quinquepunctata]|nr:hypothetical protein JTB14_030700 [Gonioctena quinquepunctata]